MIMSSLKCTIVMWRPRQETLMAENVFVRATFVSK